MTENTFIGAGRLPAVLIVFSIPFTIVLTALSFDCPPLARIALWTGLWFWNSLVLGIALGRMMKPPQPRPGSSL